MDAVAKQPVLLLTLTVVAVIGSCFLSVLTLTFHPVGRLVLADALIAYPAVRRYEPAEVREIAFGPDPDEDYVESPLPIVLCEATITLRVGRPVRLVVSAGDAARLRAWAAEKGIAVSDPDGYSTGGARRDAT